MLLLVLFMCRAQTANLLDNPFSNLLCQSSPIFYLLAPQNFTNLFYRQKTARVNSQIKFGDKKIEEIGVRDMPCFQGACEEEGAQNLKRIKQILISELYFPQLRQLRQVT